MSDVFHVLVFSPNVSFHLRSSDCDGAFSEQLALTSFLATSAELCRMTQGVSEGRVVNR